MGVHERVLLCISAFAYWIFFFTSCVHFKMISIFMHLSIAVICGEFSNSTNKNKCICDVCVCGWVDGFNPLDLGDGETEWIG